MLDICPISSCLVSVETPPHLLQILNALGDILVMRNLYASPFFQPENHLFVSMLRRNIWSQLALIIKHATQTAILELGTELLLMFIYRKSLLNEHCHVSDTRRIVSEDSFNVNPLVSFEAR